MHRTTVHNTNLTNLMNYLRLVRPGMISLGTLTALFVFSTQAAVAADSPKASFALGINPIHRDFEYDIPEKSAYDSCKVSAVREGKSSGWLATGPEGQILRRFMDTDGNGRVDQWSYYRNGLEVYRDMDTDDNEKVDQSRWLNTAGSRWGFDQNEDGVIDQWKNISAEEVSRVVVMGLRSRDFRHIKPLLITAEDLSELGIRGSAEKRVLDSVENADQRFRELLSKSKMISPKTQWMRFDAAAPSTIPGEQLKSPKDVTVYENVMVIVDVGGGTAAAPTPPGLVLLGELVRVKDVWKMTSLPSPLEGKDMQVAEIGLLMQPETGVQMASAGGTTGGLSPETEKLIKELEGWDKRMPAADASPADQLKHATGRIEILKKLSRSAQNPEERAQWTTQIAEALAAGVQADLFTEGVEELVALEADVRKQDAAAPNLPHIVYLRLVGEYSRSMRKSDNDGKAKVQERWLKALEEYLADFPQSDDSPDAALQLGNGYEFVDKMEKAREWYQKLNAAYPESTARNRSLGALRRLNMVGKEFSLTATTLQGDEISTRNMAGKIVLVVYWATWCEQCVGDFPILKQLYADYREKGFEIVGIDLDLSPEPVPAYLKRFGVTWPQVFEPGGLDSRYAVDYGIIFPPTMFLIGADGKVVNRNATVADVKTLLAETFDKDRVANKSKSPNN